MRLLSIFFFALYTISTVSAQRELDSDYSDPASVEAQNFKSSRLEAV
ncbi:MAG: hypothetical protein IID12_00060 [Candidatus Marinimicrobia bacterium]|nr:hypothetical protein [Candidatus Neomarinimicrobiota bacterium]